MPDMMNIGPVEALPERQPLPEPKLDIESLLRSQERPEPIKSLSLKTQLNSYPPMMRWFLRLGYNEQITFLQ